MKKQSLLKGTLILGSAGMIAKFLGLFFRWPIQMIIGDEGFGYYQMSYPLYMFFIAVASGIPVAVSKMVSENNAVNNREGMIQVLRKSMLLMVIMGVGFTGILLSFSKYIINYLRWDIKSYFALIGIATAPVFIAIMSALRGFFQGMQNMSPTAVSQILEQCGRVVIGVGLAYILLPKGIEYSAGGAALGATAGGIFGGIYLLLKYIKVKRELKVKKVKDDPQILTALLKIAIPISLGAAVGTIMSLIDSILVPQKLLEAGYTYKEATILYGQLSGKAFTLINVPLTLSMALCASIVPIIAEEYFLHRMEEVINKVDLSLKISMVIGLPSAAGLFMLAYPVLNLIFPGQAGGYLILKYLSICIPFIIIAQTTTSILQSIGRFFLPVINLAVGCVVKILITYFLVTIPVINIYGAVLGTIAGYVTAALLNIVKLRKTLHYEINYYEILVKPLFAALVMLISVVFIYVNVYNYTGSSRIGCLIAILCGILIYGILIFILRIFKYSYVKKRLLRR